MIVFIVALAGKRMFLRMAQDNKALKRMRVIKYFINAATEIAREKGIENITIREVADLAGYNSASMYNYFDSLDRLKAYTSINLVVDYLNDASKLHKQVSNPAERYVKIWKCYCGHAFKNPSAYSYVYSKEAPPAVFDYIKDYIELFPDAIKDVNDDLFTLFADNDIDKQDIMLIQDCIDAGFFAAEDIDDIIGFGDLLNAGCMFKISRQSGRDIDAYTEMFLKYFIDFLENKRLTKEPIFEGMDI